jgi:hypothetical protein
MQLTRKLAPKLVYGLKSLIPGLNHTFGVLIEYPPDWGGQNFSLESIQKFLTEHGFKGADMLTYRRLSQRQRFSRAGEAFQFNYPAKNFHSFQVHGFTLHENTS